MASASFPGRGDCNLLGRRRRGSSTRSRRRKSKLPARHRRLIFEGLESRMLLSVAPPHGLYPDEIFPAVDSYADLAAVDLNHDGALDLVTAGGGTGGSTIAVCLGNGDGTFGPATKYAVGSAPESLAITDLNGDSHPDLVMANYLSKTISVLLGHGDGTFLAQQSYGTGGAPRTLAIADLNRDTVADVVVGSAEATSGPYYRLSVFRGQGDGTFASSGRLCPHAQSDGTRGGRCERGLVSRHRADAVQGLRQLRPGGVSEPRQRDVGHGGRDGCCRAGCPTWSSAI